MLVENIPNQRPFQKQVISAGSGTGTGDRAAVQRRKMMKTQWINHKGKRILLADYSGFGFNVAGAQAEMETAIDLASREQPNSVLTLTDIQNTKVSPEMYNQMKITANKIAPFAFKRAVVGVSGAQRFMLDLVNKLPGQTGSKQLRAFDDVETAKNWLVSG